MLKTLPRHFENFIGDRLEEIGREMRTNHRRYQEIRDQWSEIQQRIMENLPTEERSLVYRFEEAESEGEDIFRIRVYRQGFVDGARASRMMKEMGETT